MNEPRTSAEPFLWLLFSAGGVVTALVVPVLLFLFGIAFPLGWLDPPSYVEIHALLHNPLTRLVVVGLCGLALMHAAHRLRHTVRDGLQLQRHGDGIAITCYGAAALGTAFAAYVVLTRL
ncbi:MAG TPA: fumarate reductase subunit FrdD [Micromonosporaceae bacterium]|jgi:fumarate reductase subunit D